MGLRFVFLYTIMIQQGAFQHADGRVSTKEEEAIRAVWDCCGKLDEIRTIFRSAYPGQRLNCFVLIAANDCATVPTRTQYKFNIHPAQLNWLYIRNVLLVKQMNLYAVGGNAEVFQGLRSWNTNYATSPDGANGTVHAYYFNGQLSRRPRLIRRQNATTSNTQGRVGPAQPAPAPTTASKPPPKARKRKATAKTDAEPQDAQEPPAKRKRAPRKPKATADAALAPPVASSSRTAPPPPPPTRMDGAEFAMGMGMQSSFTFTSTPMPHYPPAETATPPLPQTTLNFADQHDQSHSQLDAPTNSDWAVQAALDTMHFQAASTASRSSSTFTSPPPPPYNEPSPLAQDAGLPPQAFTLNQRVQDGQSMGQSVAGPSKVVSTHTGVEEGQDTFDSDSVLSGAYAADQAQVAGNFPGPSNHSGGYPSQIVGSSATMYPPSTGSHNGVHGSQAAGNSAANYPQAPGQYDHDAAQYGFRRSHYNYNYAQGPAMPQQTQSIHSSAYPSYPAASLLGPAYAYQTQAPQQNYAPPQAQGTTGMQPSGYCHNPAQPGAPFGPQAPQLGTDYRNQWAGSAPRR
ncbi:hypothetical protein EIP91_010887 [Steccherinum ochraceum]|uniref:Uncharacterized protein n=1 Tax=Steccherinum ochraceum TaxID=92696 RepID=A0A4R0RWK5_9APHY|nr:hypothetical protein EIP91_010887 [Steccherinum ochraceum]